MEIYFYSITNTFIIILFYAVLCFVALRHTVDMYSYSVHIPVCTICTYCYDHGNLLVWGGTGVEGGWIKDAKISHHTQAQISTRTGLPFHVSLPGCTIEASTSGHWVLMQFSSVAMLNTILLSYYYCPVGSSKGSWIEHRKCLEKCKMICVMIYINIYMVLSQAFMGRIC